MKGSGVFNQRPALNLTYKPTAMDAYKDKLFTGDEKGNIYRYQINPEEINIFSESQMMTKNLGTKSKIEQMKCLSYADGNLLVLCSETLHYVDIKQGLGITQVTKEKIKMFALNEFSKTRQFEVAAVTKNKEGIILTFNPLQNRFEQQREKFVLPEHPVTIAFIGQFFYFGAPKRQYFQINLDDKQLQVSSLPIEIGDNPFIKGTDYDELLVLTKNNFGIFVGKEGALKPKNTVNMQSHQFLNITIFKTYLVVLFENMIQVFSMSDAKNLSDMPLNPKQQAKCITTSSDSLFFATNTEIIYLYLTPPEIQIKELLAKARVDEALQVFHQHKDPNDVNVQQKQEQLRLDCAWALVKNFQFKQSDPYLLQTNFDPRDFIVLFPDYIASVQKMQSAPQDRSQKTNYLMSQVITQHVQDLALSSKEKIDTSKKIQELLGQAKEFFISVLENRRGLYTSPQYAYSMKDKLNPLTSQMCFNHNVWQPISVEEMLELIDFSLIKAYIEAGQYSRLKSFLSSNQIYCISMLQELQALLQSNKQLQDQHPGILPKFYESFHKIDLALDKWRQNGESLVSTVWTEACSETVRILKQNPDKTRIFKYIDWVLKKEMKIGSALFAHIDEQMITPDQMTKHIDELDIDEEQKRKLKEKYLEVLVEDKKIEEERFHTQLAYSYIDAIFKVHPKNTNIPDLNLNSPLLNEYYNNKLKPYLRSPNAKYNSSSILEKKVKDSWMIPEIIFLYGKEKRHDEALNKLLELNEYLWAEQYCCDQNDMLLTKLFEKYIGLYRVISQPNQSPLHEEQRRQIRDTINNFLKKYAIHAQLNPLEVLDKIPDNWKLADSGPEDGLVCFLNSVISHTLHQRRSTNAAKHLSEMDLLNVECQYAQAKKAHIKITTEKKCAVCNRSIGDKVFVVYPNAVVAHHTCIKNNSVCPVTEKDFQKYFKF